LGGTLFHDKIFSEYQKKDKTISSIGLRHWHSLQSPSLEQTQVHQQEDYTESSSSLLLWGSQSTKRIEKIELHRQQNRV